MSLAIRATTAIAACALAALTLGVSPAEALSLPKVEDPATLKECSTCHMVYQPQLLPQRSWDAMLSHLADHFGENAKLDDAMRIDILSYLLANAADAPDTKGKSGVLRGIAADSVPDRITSLPWWKGRHDEVNLSNLKSTKVKTASNCIGCHTTADKGEYHE